MRLLLFLCVDFTLFLQFHSVLHFLFTIAFFNVSSGRLAVFVFAFFFPLVMNSEKQYDYKILEFNLNFVEFFIF